jgi:hypothetical protein
MRARAKKSLESATEYGKVDAGRAAREKLCLVRFPICILGVHSGRLFIPQPSAATPSAGHRELTRPL